MARRRGFGEVERRVSATGKVTHRARYAMPDGTRYSRTLATKMDAEAWLAAERSLVDREEWTPPKARQAAESKRQAAAARNTVGSFAERFLVERGLRPTTQRNYRQLLASRILPYFGEMPLIDVTLSEIKQWRASLDPATESSNAAAYRLSASDPPVGRGGGAHLPGATEDPRRRFGSREAGRRAGDPRRARGHHRGDA